MPSQNIDASNIAVIQQDKPYHHQVPPYGLQGQPYYVSKHSLIYPDQKYKTNWICLEQRRLTEQMNKCFPQVYIYTHAVCLILNSIIQIGLQIALMATNGALWFVAAGIWGGVYFLLTALVVIFLALRRTYWLLISSYILHIFGIFVAVGAYLVVNVIGIAEYTDPCSYYPNCFNEAVKPINYIMFFLGVICIIMLLLFLALMPCYIMEVCTQCSKYKENKKAKIHHPNEVLMHSSLYGHNNLNENGTIRINSPTVTIRPYAYEYEIPITYN